jgi:hypothetical protein
MKYRAERGNIACSWEITSLESRKIVNYKNKEPDGSKEIFRHVEENELRNSAKSTLSCRITLIE